MSGVFHCEPSHQLILISKLCRLLLINIPTTFTHRILEREFPIHQAFPSLMLLPSISISSKRKRASFRRSTNSCLGRVYDIDTKITRAAPNASKCHKLVYCMLHAPAQFHPRAMIQHITGLWIHIWLILKYDRFLCQLWFKGLRPNKKRDQWKWSFFLSLDAFVAVIVIFKNSFIVTRFFIYFDIIFEVFENNSDWV